MRGRVRCRGAWSALVLLCLLAACFKPPVIQERRFTAPNDATRKIAVVPFYPRPTLERHLTEGGPDSEEAAALVTRFVTEGLSAAGFRVVPAGDVELAFSAEGLQVPRLTPGAAATLTSAEFGATSVLLGEVQRYRERSGEAFGTTRPASVSYVVTLYAAPGGERLWSGQFDETQQPLSANVFNARRYPGGGTRWLTAAELTRWGAGEIARLLRELR